MSETHVQLHLVPGKQGPLYENTVEVKCERVVITEKGMESDLPLVDFVCRGPDGTSVLMVLSGRIVNMISAAIKGVNVRNHGVPEP